MHNWSSLKMRCVLTLIVMLGFCASGLAQQRTVLQTTTLTVVEAPSFWRKVVHYATLGIVSDGQSTDAIQQNTPFRIAADHNGVDTSSYQFLINTQVVGTVPVAMLTNGTVEFAMPSGLSKGNYSITVAAVGEGGSTLSLPLSLTVTAGNPAAPGQIRIIK